MAQTNYQEPIEKEDTDVKKKFLGNLSEMEKKVSPEKTGGKEVKEIDLGESKKAEGAFEGKETGAETHEMKISEKMETARRTIGSQQPPKAVNVSDDAKVVAQITDFEKKIDKLIELALEKGPTHAIKIAQHLDKEKGGVETDNYTLDEIHDRLMEDELRKKLIEKKLLKEL